MKLSHIIEDFTETRDLPRRVKRNLEMNGYQYDTTKDGDHYYRDHARGTSIKVGLGGSYKRFDKTGQVTHEGKNGELAFAVF